MSEHQLKAWPEHWREVATGRQTFEIRKDDRNYQVGDVLVLREYDPAAEQYTGQVCTRYVTHLLHGGQFGLDVDYVCMSLAMPRHRLARLSDVVGVDEAARLAREDREAHLRAIERRHPGRSTIARAWSNGDPCPQ